MTIAKDFVSKAAVAFVAVAMIFSVFAPAAQAQSTEDLQAMINDLLAQIAGLQSQVGQGGTSVASGVCPFTWTRDLSSGSTGADVMKLQQFLNANADTRVAASGAGSVGSETEYYGPATAAAVSKMQVMYRADILTPAGLVNPTGYFGPSTRAKANSLCASAPVTGGDDDMDDDMDDDSSFELSGEASFDDDSLDSAADDDIEEGAEDAVAAEFMVEFTDGDAEISRLDVKFDSGDTSDAWDVLEEVSLWVDGEEVARMNADDEDDYQNDEMTLRFSGLDIIAMEDEELEILIAVTLQNNIDAADRDTYTVTVESLRFFDADGVATTLGSSDLSGDTATFNVEEAGFEDEIIVRENDDDPTSMTLGLEDDKKSDWFDVFLFDLDTDDSTNDIEIDEVVVRLTVGNSTGGYDALVDDVELDIDGTVIDDVTVTGTTNADGVAILTFDVDGDAVIDAGDRVPATLMVRFRSLAPANEGATILAAVNDDDVEGEGADDVVSDGSATGETHTLRTVGLTLEQTTTSSSVVNNDTTPDASYGTFTSRIEITTVGDEDIFIPETANRGASSTVGVAYVIEDAETGSTVATGTASATFKRVSGGSKSGNFWKISGDGGTAVFELKVNSFNPAASGTFRVQILSVGFNDTSATTPNSSEAATPDYDFESEEEFIQS